MKERYCKHYKHHSITVDNTFTHMAGLPQRLLLSSLTTAAFCRAFSCYSTMVNNQASASAALAASTPVGGDLSTAIPYEPPIWAGPDVFTNPPRHGRLQLANLPTPLYRLSFSKKSSDGEDSFQQRLQKLNMNLYIKRDDATGGIELGGNKIRKLEFLLADALQRDYDCVVTIGGEQSNHARATAAACRMLHLEPHLILRTRAENVDPIKMQDNLIGNLLVDRLIGSCIYTATPGEFGRFGSNEIVSRLCQHLTTTGKKKPYPIPVGGSNGIGTWGYINAVEELLQQWKSISKNTGTTEQSTSPLPSLDHIVFACGSGGTATGLVLGIALAFHHFANGNAKPPMLHAIGVCDDPDYFYSYMTKIAHEMGFVVPPPKKKKTDDDDDSSSSSSSSSWSCTESFIRAHVTVHQGKGLGYAMATPQELAFIMSFAQETGIILDPVYTGKALYHFLHSVILDNNDNDNDSAEVASTSFQNSNVLFWHTGGALGLYDKCPDLLSASNSTTSTSSTSLLTAQSPCQRLDFYGKDNGIDLSQPSK